jgi:hypothetical protein
VPAAPPTAAPPRPTTLVTPAPTAQPPLAASWGPGGALELRIDPSAVQAPKARYGDAWVLVTLDGGGEVWTAPGSLGLSATEVRALPDLAPPPTPIVQVVERRVEVPQPCGNFSQTVPVTSNTGVPLGSVTGWGCTQAAADANAAQLAEEMKR